MALDPWTIGVALIANLVVGAGLVFAVYGLMERRIVLGAIGGLVLGATVVYAEATVGAQLFDLTFGEKRLVIAVAGVGAATGISGTVLTIRPKI